MANTYTKIYIHIVFAVSGRANLLPRARKEELNKMLTDIVQARGTHVVRVNNEPDHVHMIIALTRLLLFQMRSEMRSPFPRN